MKNTFGSTRFLFQPGDFIYLDPPYDKITSFKYNETIFTREQQIKIVELCHYIDSIGHILWYQILIHYL